MGTDYYKWHVHCPVCGAFLEKSSQSDSEVDCKKCKSTLEVLSVRPMIIRDEQLKARMRVYAQSIRSGSGKKNQIG